MNLHNLRLLVAGFATLLLLAPAFAQNFPDRPVRLVVPYAAGGTADALARALAEHMRKSLGQPVVVDNKPGGNTAVGALAVAGAPADGHTLLLGTGSTIVTNPLLSSKLAYNPADLAAVGRVAVAPLVALVHPAVPAHTLGELLQQARAQPGKFNYASTGTGSVVQLGSLLLESAGGVQMTHVPFNGSTPALAALLGGQVELFITTPERLKVLPDVPAIAESFPGFDASAWYGVLAPARTPQPVIDRLNAAIAVALADKGFREQFEALGLSVLQPANAAAFTEFIRREHERWGPVVRARKLSLD
jgi:tripartite-type tricarboxylate transporter receptor subunit TctC